MKGGGEKVRPNSLVHEQSPNEILELPHRSNTSDLEDEKTIVVEEVVNLLEES